MNQYRIPMVLETPRGSLTINPSSGDGIYLSGIRIGVEDRARYEGAPQNDGAIFHRGFRGATIITYTGFVLAEAGASTAVTLMDSLRGHLESLRRDDGRMRFTPSGAAERMWDDIRLHAFADITGGQGLAPKQFEFALRTPFPYAMTHTQTSTPLGATVNNTGNANMWPVFKAYDSSFTIANTTTSQTIQFTGTGAGGGNYVEITCWPHKRTAFLNGNGANQLRYLVVPSNSWIYLAPGSNTLTYTGTSCTMLWQPAHA